MLNSVFQVFLPFSIQSLTWKHTHWQVSIVLVLALAVANRVLNKMATVPMGDYLFFLAQIQTFGYVAFYSAILYSRKK